LMVKRDNHPNFPGVDGFWFQIEDTNGHLRHIQVPSGNLDPADVDKRNDHLGWCSLGAVGLGATPHTIDLDSLKDGLLGLTLGIPTFQKYEVFRSKTSTAPLKDNVTLDLNRVGLLKNDPLIFKEMLVFWFRVIGENGNSIALDDPALDLNWDEKGGNTDIGWLPFTGSYNAYQLKNLVIGDHFPDQYPKKYEVYASDISQTPIMGVQNVNLKAYGVKSSAPINFRLIQDYDNNGDSDDDNNGDNNGDSDGDTDEENTNDDVYNPPDEYASFTRQIQCTSHADWSRYPEAIQGTYPGEILWTDGNLAYGVANMMAYMVIRRDPQSGCVLAAGRAPDAPAYFVLLG